jgi:hypothetical protein
MTRPLVLVSLLALVTAAPAQALDFGDGWSTTGEFELEAYHSSGDTETIGYGTADLAYQQPAGGFGAFVGFDAVSTGGDNESALYGALSYSGGFGKVQVGVPRAVLDDYVDTPSLAGLRIFDLGFGGVTGSIVTQAYLLQDSDVPVGLRYDGTFGDAKLGVSYHRIEDADVLDLAVNYQLGAALLRGGIEHVNDSGSSATAYHIGAEGSFGPVTAGLMYSDSEDFFSARILKGYATYSPIDKLNLTGSIWSFDQGGSNGTIYGVAADYTFAQGIYLEGGVADGTNSTDTIVNASLGLKF